MSRPGQAIMIARRAYFNRFAELVAVRSPHPALRADLSQGER